MGRPGAFAADIIIARQPLKPTPGLEPATTAESAPGAKTTAAKPSSAARQPT
jgi:hypothetical protein